MGILDPIYLARSRIFLRPSMIAVAADYLKPSVSVAVKIALDLNIFDRLDTDGPGKSSDDLAQETGAEAFLLGRILRLLESAYVVKEVDANRFIATEFSGALTSPGYVGGFTSLFSSVWPVFTKLPEYLAQHEYRSPDDAYNGPFQFGKQTTLHRAKWLQAHPEEGRAFNALMGEFHKQPYSWWLEIYPPSNLTKSFETVENQHSYPLIVDIGGGIGRDMENLRQKLLPSNYTIMVQDLPQVVAQGKQLHPALNFKEIDFFKEQPIHGACTYFMQNVLHDWPDDKAREILQNISSSFRPNFSKLLLCENVMPEKGIRSMAGALDIVMMAFLCARERTESDWIQLLESAGYRLIHIWRTSTTHRCVIEAELQS